MTKLERAREIFDTGLREMNAKTLALLAQEHEAGRLTNEQLAEAQAMVRQRIAAMRDLVDEILRGGA